jgi:quercetin dioxygenase-like cupin family protein
MEIKVAEAVEAQPVEMEGARGVTMRMLIGPEQEAPNFHMRLFTVEPEGHTPQHAHPWEHEVYVLAGEGAVRTSDGDLPVKAGDCVYVSPGEDHSFANAGLTPLQFLCMVPKPA